MQVVKAMQVNGVSSHKQVTFELSGPIRYKLFTLNHPHRVVIDIEQGRFDANKLDKLNLKAVQVKKVRSGFQPGGVLRIVLDMDEAVQPRAFVVAKGKGAQLVLEWTIKRKASQGKQETRPATPVVQEQTVLPAQEMIMPHEFVVAIDPGHGGEDTGAIGQRFGLLEKEVVLAVAKRLEKLINAQPGVRAYLVRSGDYFIGLRKRMELSRAQGADLFLSLHADSFNDPRATGASVYVLSEKGASTEAARWLAESENRADLVGGISLEGKGEMLASVLLDLSQTASKSASQEVAHYLVSHLGKITDLHHKTVQHAGFMVLKSPDIPSVLVELGFISNEKGEQQLSTAVHQQALAKALLEGVKAYLAKRAYPLKPASQFMVVQKEKRSSVTEQTHRTGSSHG